AIAGAAVLVLRNGEPVPMHQPVALSPGDSLKIGRIEGPGMRCYLAVAGGIESPDYLGSASTFTLGKFGGPFGRALLPGDVLGMRSDDTLVVTKGGQECPPSLTHHWKIGVLYGPHGAPDFFLDEDIATFFATDWEVHYNS